MKKRKFTLREEVRCEIYRLLAQCYYAPDENIFETFKNLMELSGQNPGNDVRDPVDDDFTSIIVDHARLFVGPYQILAPPYGSIYMENTGMIMGESTIEAVNRYEESGLNIVIKEVPDHIAIELEFMYFLIFHEIEQAKNHNLERASHFQAKQSEFLDNHLGRWVLAFADRIMENAETNFYRSLALFTRKFIGDDLKSLSKIDKDFIPYSSVFTHKKPSSTGINI